MASTAKRKTSPASFLLKLREVLAREDPAVISWDGDGRITIGDPKRLGDEVLTRYFRHGNFSSFQRQLNYFGYYKVQGKGRLSACVYTNDALAAAEGGPPDLPVDALLALKRKSSREGAAAAAAAAAARRAPARPGTARQASMRAARAEKEQARAAQAVSVSPDPRAAKRPRALSEGTVVTVETLASDVGELEDPLDAFFDHSPALFCEEAWDAPPPRPPSPGWLGGGCDAAAAAAAAAAPPPGAWADRPIAASRPELWIGPAVASPF